MENRAATIGTVYGTALMQGLVVVSFPASGALLRAAHHFSDAQYGAIFLPQTAMAIAGSLLAGGLARKLGLRALLRLALAAGVLAELLLAATVLLAPGPAYAAVLGAIGLAGLGFGLASAPLNTYPGVLFPTRRESALVILHTLVGAGFAIGPLLAGAAMGAGRWFVFPLSLAAAAGVLVAGPLPSGPAAGARTSTSGSKPLGSSRFWMLVGIAVVYALCEGTFSSWVGIFLEEERHVSPASAALALSMFWAALVAGRLIVSVLVLRVPSRLIWAALPLVMLAAFLLLPEARGAASGAALFALAGFGCSAFFPLTVGFAGEVFRDHVAWVSSMLTASLMLGVGAGSFALGALRKVAGLASLYRGSAAYAVVLLVLVASLARRKGETK